MKQKLKLKLKNNLMTDQYICKANVLKYYFSTIMLAILFYSSGAWALEPNSAIGDAESRNVMKEFIQDDRSAKSEIVSIPDQRKRLIMFIMGIPLLIFILITVSLGVAMVVYGKNVFVAHMIFAGLSLTLAMGHAVVGVVWFNPF